MPTDACQFFYECTSCKAMLRPKAGDCCVFCSYGSVKCPPVQEQRGCCASPWDERAPRAGDVSGTPSDPVYPPGRATDAAGFRRWPPRTALLAVSAAPAPQRHSPRGNPAPRRCRCERFAVARGCTEIALHNPTAAAQLGPLREPAQTSPRARVSPLQTRPRRPVAASCMAASTYLRLAVLTCRPTPMRGRVTPPPTRSSSPPLPANP
jgi:hypothetical protein